MAFTPVPEQDDNQGGNFSADAREFYNSCGRSGYLGTIHFASAEHLPRTVPVFESETLFSKPETYKLVHQTRKAMSQRRTTFATSEVNNAGRSIHQNTSGNLPYLKPDPRTARGAAYITPDTRVAAPSLRHQAQEHGALPNNQQQRGAQTRGEFLEITCGDGMHAYARLVVDYRWGIIYITLGHYHPDSFALLVRHEHELHNDVRPALEQMNVRFSR